MAKQTCFFVAILPILWASTAAGAAADYMRTNTYDNMYPYMNNTMRTQLNPGTNPNRAPSQISTLTRVNAQNKTGNARRVVPRTARASSTGNTMTARAATPVRSGGAAVSNSNSASNRRVVARSGVRTATAAARTSRSDTYDNTRNAPTQTNSVTVRDAVSISRCLADYTDCMNGYCERKQTAYDRCYCSSKLAQIEAKYQPEIDSLIKQILTARNENIWTDNEINQYWSDTIGKYTGDNSWLNLDQMLNIDWAGAESRVRGQQTFATAHDYCSQHLRACAYMANNMRDAYRSEIARDCATYETSLQRIKNAAESILETYK